MHGEVGQLSKMEQYCGKLLPKIDKHNYTQNASQRQLNELSDYGKQAYIYGKSKYSSKSQTITKTLDWVYRRGYLPKFNAHLLWIENIII